MVDVNDKERHQRRVLVPDSDLTRLRSQAEFMALNDRLSWRQLADALAELEERRKEDTQETIA